MRRVSVLSGSAFRSALIILAVLAVVLGVAGFGGLSAANAVAGIVATKQVPFRRVLFGLNIPDVGWVTAQNLVRHFGNVGRLGAATTEEMVECEGIGPERAEAIVEWFSDAENRALVAEL